MIQCEQLKSELERQTERLEKELASQQEKRALEKEMIKKEVAKEREDAESKVPCRHFPMAVRTHLRGRAGFGSQCQSQEGSAELLAVGVCTPASHASSPGAFCRPPVHL